MLIKIFLFIYFFYFNAVIIYNMLWYDIIMQSDKIHINVIKI